MVFWKTITVELFRFLIDLFLQPPGLYPANVQQCVSGLLLELNYHGLWRNYCSAKKLAKITLFQISCSLIAFIALESIGMT